MELEIMRLRNEINKIGLNINQIVKNSNSHMYRDDDKIKLLMISIASTITGRLLLSYVLGIIFDMG